MGRSLLIIGPDLLGSLRMLIIRLLGDATCSVEYYSVFQLFESNSVPIEFGPLPETRLHCSPPPRSHPRAETAAMEASR